jgi:hypothetical protein
VYVSEIPTVITGMRANTLSNQFLDLRDKVIQTQSAECQVCSLQASSEGRHVKSLWRLDFLSGDLVGPECVGFEGLRDAIGSEISVFPAVCAVAGLLAPVAVPGWSAVVGLSCVVVAFAVAADEEEFVGCV